MKRFFLLIALWCAYSIAQAEPRNLYEQLCEINQEWLKNRAIASELGFLNMPVIEGEQNILTFHIQTLEQIFANRDASHLSKNLQQARAKQIQTLHEYGQRQDCPRNYYLPFRNPVFIDHEGRYCAVAYLMKAGGKQTFCEAVQASNNYIFIRQITNPEFHTWQQESGLSLDELAWIQPGYKPFVQFIDWDKRDAKNNLILLNETESKKIYNYDTDRVDLLGLDTYYSLELLPKILRRANVAFANTHKPNWDFFEKTERVIHAMSVIQNNLYVVTDSSWITYTTSDSSKYEYKVANSLWKWDKKDKWHLVSNLKSNSHAKCLFESKGKLYLGGGHEIEGIFDEKTEQYILPITHSFLASFNGKEWKVSQEEYGGYIVGLVYKNGKRYLATMYNEWGATRSPINQPKTTAKGGK